MEIITETHQEVEKKKKKNIEDDQQILTTKKQKMNEPSELVVKQWYELTNHPKLFQHTYWGNFTNHPTNHPGDNIIENRNKFVADYKIKKMGGWPNKLKNMLFWTACRVDGPIGGLYDHAEFYTAEESYVCVLSPYKDYPEQYGFKRIYPLYMNDATTYVFEIFNKPLPGGIKFVL